MDLILFFIGLGVLSFSIAYAITKKTRSAPKVRKKRPAILPGTTLRVRCPMGSFRVKVEASDENEIVFHAPTHRDSHVPLRPGDTLHVEAPLPSGVMVFRAPLLSRDAETKLMTMAFPDSVMIRDRRAEPRETYLNPLPAQLNDEPATVVNRSSKGAKICTTAQIEAGEVVRVKWEDGTDQLAYVLEVLPDVLHGRPASALRLIHQA